MLEIVAILDSVKTNTRELAALEMIIMLLVAAVLGYILRGFIDQRIMSSGSKEEKQEKSPSRRERRRSSAADEDGFDDSTDDFDFEDDDMADDGMSEDDFEVQEESDSEDYGDFFDDEEKKPEESSQTTTESKVAKITQPGESKAAHTEETTDKSQTIQFDNEQNQTVDDEVNTSKEGEKTEDDVVEISDLNFDAPENKEEEQEEATEEGPAEEMDDSDVDQESEEDAKEEVVKGDTNEDENEKSSSGKISHFAPKIEPLQTSPIASFRAKDDLKRIEGVGPKIEEILNQAGIKSYSDLANSDGDTLNGMLKAAGSRFRMHDATSWPEQAKLALNNEWDALEQLQSKLNRGK